MRILLKNNTNEIIDFKFGDRDSFVVLPRSKQSAYLYVRKLNPGENNLTEINVSGLSGNRVIPHRKKVEIKNYSRLICEMDKFGKLFLFCEGIPMYSN